MCQVDSPHRGIKGLLRLYRGSPDALFRLYSGCIQAVFRLYLYRVDGPHGGRFKMELKDVADDPVRGATCVAPAASVCVLLYQ